MEAAFAQMTRLRVGLVIGANLPVQQSTKVELIISLNAAKTLGPNTPLPTLAGADEGVG
jgi:hypothetical protein